MQVPGVEEPKQRMSRIHSAFAVERLMIAVPGHQHLSRQTRDATPCLIGRLGAGTMASQIPQPTLVAHRTLNFEARHHELQHLANVLAQQFRCRHMPGSRNLSPFLDWQGRSEEPTRRGRFGLAQLPWPGQ